MSSEKKHLTLFFISVFLHFVSCQCMNSFCLYFDSRRIHELDFLLQRLACSSLTPRWFIEALRCINDLVHSEFPISALPCCTVLIMISARVIGLRSVESDVFYNSWPAEKCKNFLHQRHSDTEERWLIMATRWKLSRLFLRLTRDLSFYEHILGPMM